jgi:uncharacterized membrane protein
MNAFVGITGGILAGDAIWLTLRQPYHNNLFQAIQKSPLTIRWIPAIFVYVFLVFAIYQVAVKSAKTMKDAITKGLVVGGVMYGFYDFTNWATLQQWTAYMTFTDMIWGAIVGGIGAAAGYYFL